MADIHIFDSLILSLYPFLKRKLLARKSSSVKEKSGKVTPLMKQYFKIKAKNPDAILLFRVGDFYETFGEDAVKVSEVLGIVLTSRNNGGSDIELAGFPYHAIDMYLPKLVRAGYRVAICEQLEKPSKEKKLVKRGVTEMVTPGVATDEKLLDHKKNNFLASIHFAPRDHYGIALLDISTGEFLVSEGSMETVDKLLQSLQPSEIILAKAHKEAFEKRFGSEYYIYTLDEWVYTLEFGRDQLLTHFEVQSLKGFSIDDLEAAQTAAGACLQYLADTQHGELQHIRSVNRIHPEEYMWMDRFTIRNLELLHPAFPTGKALVDIVDTCASPMGSRLLRKWLLLPLRAVAAIEARQNVVAFAMDHEEMRDAILAQIKRIGDLERLISKVSMGKVNPREMLQLNRALRAIVPIRELLSGSGQEQLMGFADALNPCEKLIDQIARAIHEEAPVSLSKGNAIADGYDEELDDLRHTIRNSKELLVQIQQTEAGRTGIQNLKIGFNNVFGYYLEVTNKYKDQGLIPESWVRKQTLTNAERYITDELKKLEQKILGAEEQIALIEERLYLELITAAQSFIPPVQHNASVIAQLDCLIAFARNALRHNYCRPVMDESLVLDIREGRHPVIECQLPLGEAYVPNDVYLDSDTQQILMITGPNMSGKSALLRQTALISILAQMGSFVPATKAHLGILDKLFTRVGASDNISSGESTFMVEMNETASIMNNISSRSLILLDEIGRGTSTYDGISIAWSVAEFLHDNTYGRPKTLFATHYHELNDLAETHERIRNFHVSTKEINNKVIFLRKLVAGGSEHSFGIHVAKMAGMPGSILHRAQQILREMEKKALSGDSRERPSSPAVPDRDERMQLSIFEHVDPTAGKLKEILEDVEINRMTPIECMMKLLEMKKLVDEDNE